MKHVFFILIFTFFNSPLTLAQSEKSEAQPVQENQETRSSYFKIQHQSGSDEVVWEYEGYEGDDFNPMAFVELFDLGLGLSGLFLALLGSLMIIFLALLGIGLSLIPILLGIALLCGLMFLPAFIPLFVLFAICYTTISLLRRFFLGKKPRTARQ